MLFAGTAGLMFPWSLMYRSREARIAPSAAAAAGDDHALIWAGKIEYLLARRLVIYDRSNRNFQNYIFAFAAALVRAFAVTSTLGLVFGIEAEVHQRVVPLAGFHDHIAAVAPVASRWTAARNIFFAAKGHAAIAAVTRFDPYFCLIDEHVR